MCIAKEVSGWIDHDPTILDKGLVLDGANFNTVTTPLEQLGEGLHRVDVASISGDGDGDGRRCDR